MPWYSGDTAKELRGREDSEAADGCAQKRAEVLDVSGKKVVRVGGERPQQNGLILGGKVGDETGRGTASMSTVTAMRASSPARRCRRFLCRRV